MQGFDAADKIEAVHQEVRQMLHQKLSDEVIIHQLIKKGYEPYYAEMILENVRSDKHDRKGFWITLFYGLGFFLAGFILTLLTRHLAIKFGALYYLCFWGLIVAGVTFIARAFIIFKK